MRKSLRLIALSLLAALSLNAAAQQKENPTSVALDVHECYVEQTFTTTDPEMFYYVSYLEKNIFDELGYNDDATLAQADKTWFDEMAEGYDMSVEEIVDGFTYKGNATEFQASLLPDHDYVLWLHGVDTVGNCTTTITRTAFHTLPVQTIANHIDLKAEKVAEGIQVVCTPDDNSINYTLGSVAKENMVDEFTGEPLSLRDYMQYGFSNAMYDYLAADEFHRIFEEMANKGPRTLTFGNLEEGVEYYIVAAYLDSEAGICSEIATVEIDGEGNLTSINNVKSSKPIVADGVYTLDGTRVGATLRDVQRGVYIVKFNGRIHKVVKK